MSNIEIACAKYCYDGPENENPSFTLEYGGDSPDYSDPISGLENRNLPHSSRQPCVKRSEKKTSLNPEEGADVGLSAAFSVAAEASNGYQVEPELNENTPLASTGSPEGFNGVNNGDSAIVPDAGNINQEVFETQVKRNVPRHQQQREVDFSSILRRKLNPRLLRAPVSAR